jgi:hypothetical protein
MSVVPGLDNGDVLPGNTGWCTSPLGGQEVSHQTTFWLRRRSEHAPSAHHSPTARMAFRKRAAGAGFEVAFEAERFLFSWKFDRDSDPPWSVRNGAAAWTVVVPLQALVNVARVADVVPTRISLAAEYVHEALSDSPHVTDQNHNSDQLKHARVRTNIFFGMDFLQFSARFESQEMRSAFAPLLRRRCYGETAFACWCVRVNWACEGLTPTCLPSRSSREA